MTERKFTRGLNKPGMAAQLRETVSQVVRESTVLVRKIFYICFAYNLHSYVIQNYTSIDLPLDCNIHNITLITP